MRKWIVSILGATVLLGAINTHAGAQDQAVPQAPGSLLPPGGDISFDTTQPIKPGFVLSITTVANGNKEEELSGSFTVDPAGVIVMKLIGTVLVKDRTPTEAADLVAGKVKALIKDPKVTITITSVPKPSVLFSGAVLKSGASQINLGTTLVEALTVFGFTENADLGRVRIVHKDAAGKRVTTEYNVIRWLHPAVGQQPDDAQNPVLQDKDFIFVPLKNLPLAGNVTIGGSVAKPGVVPLRYGVNTTVREAVSLAGGVAAAADRRRIILRRAGREEVITIDADKAERGDPQNDLVLVNDDVLYVETLPTDQFINMNGAFVRPGKLPVNKPMTLTQAISEASGLTVVAKAHKGIVIRHPNGSSDPTKTQTIAFNYNKVREGRERDIMLMAGDTVEIPTGVGPRPALSGLELAQSLMSIALIVDRLFSGRSSGGGF